MKIINTNNYHSVQELNDALEAIQDETALFTGRLVMTITPATITKERIAHRIALRIAQRPAILEELTQALNSQSEPWND